MTSTGPPVLDASIILALYFGERGAAALTREFLETAVASSVNLAEVQARLVSTGFPAGEAWIGATSFVASVEPFTGQQAKLAGALIAQTRKWGLSLGDRACLALAITLDAPVYTADRVWGGLNLGIPIHVIR